jgi:EpsI family protein
MIAAVWAWVPAGLLSAGALLTYGGMHEQLSMPLRAQLETTVPTELNGFRSYDVQVSEEEQAVAGMDNYVMRVYSPEGAPGSAEAFSVYVGYYERQSQGHSIHSPKNCLPGGGWEPLTSGVATIATPGGPVKVNRYLIGNGPAKALVLYWYQGRGRVAASEYQVKWELLKDQALRGRSDEALVRVIVPVMESEQAAFEQASQIASNLVPSVSRALPS